MVFYPPDASATMLAAAALSNLHQADTYNVEGYSHFYMAELLDRGTRQELDLSMGRLIANAIQEGFTAAGYDDTRIRVRYGLERTEVNMGTSPKLEFQVDTTLERPEFLMAIAAAMQHAVAAANAVDMKGRGSRMTAVTR